jgi:hypothetical protein
VSLEEFSAVATTFKKQKKISMCMVPQTKYILYFSGVHKCLGVLLETNSMAFNRIVTCFIINP